MAVSQWPRINPHSSPKQQLLCIEPKKSDSNKRTRGLLQIPSDILTSSMERAKEVQANLGPEFPSFIKTMLHSHVSRGFSLSLSRKFCDLHLSKHDETVVLEDETGKVFETKYLGVKGVLSGGWKGFSIANKLVEGDVLVFHLVSSFKFKVYIIRSRGSDEVDCALGLLEFEAHNEQEDTLGIVAFEDGAKRLKPFIEVSSDGDDNNQKNSYGLSDQSDKESDNIIPVSKRAQVAPKKSLSNVRKEVVVQSLCGNRSSAMEQAKAVQANLAPECPSFVKYMVQSNVSRCFCLNLPKRFCDLHLPKQDEIILLEDEDGKVSESKYLPRKTGLSAGWRGFSIAHKLVEGDVLVFHLISPIKFKIYIIRSNGSDEVDCALGLLNLEAHNSQADNMAFVAFEDRTESLNPSLDGRADNDHDSKKICDYSDKDGNDISSEVLDGIKLSDSAIDFEVVRSIDDFKILVNGLVINSELSKYLQGKYYELCRSQKAFLHENLLEGLNCKLVAGVISETINIADAIRASKITSSVNDFSIWAKTLIAFEGLGMNVGFLRTRLDKLLNLATKAKRFEKVREERENAHDELKMLEEKVLVAKQELTTLDAEFETLELDYPKLELMFEEVARTPW